MREIRIAVVALEKQYISRAEALSRQLNLDFVSADLHLHRGHQHQGGQHQGDLAHYCYFLCYGIEGLHLQSAASLSPSPLRVNFADKSFSYRRKHSGKSQAIAKAVGIKPRATLSILDATAGLGKDSFVLASLGCEMQLLERSPVVHALLQDGIQRALESRDEVLVSIARRITLHLGDAETWFKKLPVADVIYLDPMFPVRTKSAKVKKDMVVLQNILDHGDDIVPLLSSAIKCARYRVVLKRPRKAALIEGFSPNYQLLGKSSRYDVYLTV